VWVNLPVLVKRVADNQTMISMTSQSNIHIRVICTIIALLLIPIVLFSQNDNSEQKQAATDTTLSDDVVSPHSLYGSFGYGSNMVYLGTSISQNQPYGYAGLTYGLNSKLFFSVSSMNLSGFKPFLSLNTGSLIYNHIFNSWFDISAGLYGYHVAPELADTLFSSFGYADFTLGIDWRLVYSKVSAGALIAGEPQVYFQFRNSRYFQTGEIFRGKANISFDPYVNMIFSSRTTVSTVSGAGTIISAVPPFGKGRQKNQNTPETTFSRSFNITEIDFGLPVSLNFDFITIEIEAGYVMPLNNTAPGGSAKGFLLVASGFFRIL
jgi:hypothetical protein